MYEKVISNSIAINSIGDFIDPFLSITTLKNSALAQSWDKLGQRKVNFKADRDEISGHWDGIFAALQIKVRGGSVSMQKMVVHFRNGETHEVELKNNLLVEVLVALLICPASAVLLINVYSGMKRPKQIPEANLQ